MRRSAKKKYVKATNIKDLDIEYFIKRLQILSDSRLGTWHFEYGVQGNDPFYADGSMWHAPVKDMFYRVNSDGISGEDFSPDAQGLALGCSVTAGCGLWHKWTWPYILSCELGYDINCFAAPGRGLREIIDRLFIYIRKYGKPKNLFILTPDTFRLRVLEMEKSGEKRWPIAFTYPWYTDFDNYAEGLKRGPHVYESILGNKFMYPIELSIMQFAEEISRIETMCECMDIKLKISSWDGLAGRSLGKVLSNGVFCTDLHLNEADLFEMRGLTNYPEICHTVDHYIEEIENLSCHKNHPISKNKYWSYAADDIHPGIHAHIHYAERFLGRPLSDRVLDIINQPLPNVDVVRRQV